MQHDLSGAALLIMLPAVLAHELTHAAATLPIHGADVETISLYPPRATLTYPPGTSWWAIRAVNLAPTIVGTAVGLPILVWVVTSWSVAPPLLAYIAGSWAVYTAPSEQDRRPRKFARPAN